MPPLTVHLLSVQLVLPVGLEPTSREAPEFKSSAFADFATRACGCLLMGTVVAQASSAIEARGLGSLER